MKSKTQSLGILAAAILVGGFSASAQTAPAPDKTAWKTIAAAGFTMTSGNSDTVMTTVGLDTSKKWDSEEIALGISGGYGKSEGTRNADFAKAYGQYNHLISERAYFGLRVDGEHDGIADLVYRVRISPLLGYYLIKNEKTSLSFDAGPSLVIERFEGPTATTDTYLAARFGEKFEHQLSETTKIWQTAEYIPSIKDWMDKYLINAEVGISTAITPKWGLRVVAQLSHDSDPAPGRESNDFRLIAGTDYKF